jgi:hypothetical protein
LLPNHLTIFVTETGEFAVSGSDIAVGPKRPCTSSEKIPMAAQARRHRLESLGIGFDTVLFSKFRRRGRTVLMQDLGNITAHSLPQEPSPSMRPPSRPTACPVVESPSAVCYSSFVLLHFFCGFFLWFIDVMALLLYRNPLLTHKEGAIITLPGTLITANCTMGQPDTGKPVLRQSVVLSKRR